MLKVQNIDRHGRSLFERADLLAEVSEALYAATSSFAGDDLGTDLAYLYPAIIKGTQVQWLEREARQVAEMWGEDPECAAEVALHNTLLLFRYLFPEGHAVWDYIDVLPE